MYKLLCGNYLELINKIPDRSIDCVITDPPYEHVMGGMKSKKYKGIWKSDSYMNLKMSQFKHDDIFLFLDTVIPKMKKINMYIFCSKLQLAHYFDYINIHSKLKFDLLIWDKSSTENKYSIKSSKFFTSDIEYIVRIYESGVSLNKIEKDGTTISSFYMKRQKFSKPNSLHESMKPVKLLEQYILLSTDLNDIILDPFMGSGSTGIACLHTKRTFIGIELNENYYETAKNRIDTEYKLIEEISNNT